MRKILLTSLAVFFMASTAVICQEGATKGLAIKGFPFYVYSDGASRLNHFIPSGWMGDTGDLKYTGNWKTNCKSGKSCIQIRYSGEKKQSAGWAGIYWQYPANNWGTQKGGFDLTGATSLNFWARGEKGGEIVEFKAGGIAGEYPDTSSATTGPVELTKEWKQFTIDTSKEDMSYVNGGFCLVLAADTDPDGATIYIDEIVYNGKPELKTETQTEIKTETKAETKTETKTETKPQTTPPKAK
jgi:hypothetical protein